uniref:tubulin epsilon and delta complex protein 2 isoform X2 n=1 Tax=Pristiophorus japonicus TaxID=55135 RepID=UPI00398F336A
MEPLPARQVCQAENIPEISCGRGKHDCSSEELQELEMLNRALANALRIRQAQPNVHGTELIPRTGCAIAKQPPAARCGDKPSPGIVSRNKAASTNTSNVGSKVAAAECKKSCLPSHSTDRLAGERIAAHVVSSRKLVSCTLKAPYKTQVEVKRKLVSSAAGQLARGSLETGSSAVQTAATRHTKRPISIDRAGSTTRQYRLRSLTTAPRTVTPHGVQTPADTGTAPTPAFAVISQQRVNSIKESVHSRDSAGNILQDDGSSMERPKFFTLQGSGSMLKLPLEWRKQRSRNARLWEKVSASETDAIKEKACFMQRIQSAFHSQLPTVSYVQIEEQLGNIRDLHKCIEQCLRTDSLLNSSGPLSRQHEYESQQTLTRCQDTVSSLLYQIQQFTDAEAFWVKFGGCWRPSFKMCKGFGSKCAPLLFYSSLQELKEMETLWFQVQTLQRQIQIQKAMAEELLPILFSSGPPEQSLFYFYRAVYSQLCEGGEQFPVLVLDNIPE